MKINIISDDNWEGIYVNGKLVSQNHPHSAKDALKVVGLEVEYAECDPDWLADRDGLPLNLEEVQF